jgi:HK97 family phage portal protein
MGMLERIIGVFNRRNAPTVGQLREWIYGGPALAGVSVSEETALGITPFYRGVDLISSTIASLDGGVARKDDRGRITDLPRHPVSLLLDDPTDLINKYKFLKTLITHVVCSGNGYAEIERATNDQPIALHNVHWRNVRIDVVNGSVLYHVRGRDKPVQSKDLIHLTMLSWDGIKGISPIQANREALGLAIAQERYLGALFANGAAPRGYLKSTGKMNDQTKANIREYFETIHKGVDQSGKVGILPPDLEWVAANMTPADAEVLVSRKFSIEEVARILGIPVNLLFSGEQGSYNSNAEANLQFYQLGLRAIIENLESEYDHKLLSREERFAGLNVRFDISSILRGDFRSQTEAWRLLWLAGLCSRNEGRAGCGLNPLDGPDGDDILTPANMLIDGQLPGAGAQSQPTPPTGATSPLGASAGQGALEAPATVQKALEAARDTTEPIEVRAAEIAASLRVCEATKAALVDQIDRGLRRQVKGRPSAEEHREYVVGALGHAVDAYAAAHGLGANVEDLAARWVEITSQTDPGSEGVSDLILKSLGEGIQDG